MRNALLALSLGAALCVGSVAAEAMPAGPVAVVSSGAPELVLVSGGCGIAFHRGPYGVCRPNGVIVPYGRPYLGYGPGWHRGWHRGWHHW